METVPCLSLSNLLASTTYGSDLEGRGTDSPEVIESRIAKAEYELGFTGQFDKVVVNDDLETAQKDALKIIREFLNK